MPRPRQPAPRDAEGPISAPARREPFKGSLELAVNKPGEEAPPEPRGLSAWVRGAASRVGYGAASAAAPPVSVEELLAEYNKAEVLEDYRCDGCGKKGCAETPPPVRAGWRPISSTSYPTI